MRVGPFLLRMARERYQAPFVKKRRLALEPILPCFYSDIMVVTLSGDAQKLRKKKRTRNETAKTDKEGKAEERKRLDHIDDAAGASVKKKAKILDAAPPQLGMMRQNNVEPVAIEEAGLRAFVALGQAAMHAVDDEKEAMDRKDHSKDGRPSFLKGPRKGPAPLNADIDHPNPLVTLERIQAKMDAALLKL